jgi:uncharacterized protein YbjT (DUF2867 family)
MTDGFRVRALVQGDLRFSREQSRFEVWHGDVRDPTSLTRAVRGCDIVFHLAGRAHDLATVNDSRAGRDHVRRNPEPALGFDRMASLCVSYASTARPCMEEGMTQLWTRR